MLAAAGFDMQTAAALAVRHARLGRALGRLPAPVLHRLISTLARAETWARWPLRTLHTLDHVEETFNRIDPDGSRFGLTPEVRRGFRRHLLYDTVAGLAVLVNKIDDEGFRRRSLAVSGEEGLRETAATHRGALVVGFRLGAHPLLPLVLGALGHDVCMIVAGERLAEMGEALGRAYAPRAAARVRYVDAAHRLVLARAMEALNRGGIVSTLAELSPLPFQKRTEVRFLDWTVRAPYGIPYLSAVTGRPVVPAALTSAGGGRFRLEFLAPLTVPGRDRASILAATQDLYAVLQQQVLRYPDQWVGWTILESHLGIDLGRPAPLRMPTATVR